MTAAYADNGAAIAPERKTEKRSSTGSSSSNSGSGAIGASTKNSSEERESVEETFDCTEKSPVMPQVATGGDHGSENTIQDPSSDATDADIDRAEKETFEFEGGASADTTEITESAKAAQNAEDSQSAETAETSQTAECSADESARSREIDEGTSNPIDGSSVNPHDETSNRNDGHRVRKPVWPSCNNATADESRNVDDARCAPVECNVASNTSWPVDDDSISASRSYAEKSSCPFETNEALKEQLQEVQRLSIRKCVVTSVNNATYGKSSSFQDGNLSDVGRETYDPEAELNFYEAVRMGDARCVASLLKNGSVQNPDEPDWNVSGDPPLLVAATNHCLPVLRVLLENGCDPAVRSPRGETALHRIILNGGPGNVLKFVVELLNHGCPPGVKEAGGGSTALHVLTRQLAHAQGSKSLHHDFESALKALELLAKAGPVNAKDHLGRSALHILASSSIFDNSHRTEIESLINILLAAGADPSLKNDRGETPLHECLECGALNTAFLLLKHTPVGISSRYGETPLHIASRKNYVDMVASLLKHGEDPGLQDAGGNTALHLASARGFHQTVSLLVTSPLAQLEKANAEGLTALQVAAESGFVNAVRLLLKAGADPSQTVPYCATTLHRHPDISVLIDHELTRRRQLAA